MLSDTPLIGLILLLISTDSL